MLLGWLLRSGVLSPSNQAAAHVLLSVRLLCHCTPTAVFPLESGYVRVTGRCNQHLTTAAALP